MTILIVSLGSYPHDYSIFRSDESLGIMVKPYKKWLYDIVNEQLFFLSVLKYGILWVEK
jgi:hypothetical protein